MAGQHHISTVANELEARALFENNGYDNYEVDELMSIYKRVVKHIGFKDRRRDKRFVVKFHDVFLYAPDAYNDDTDLRAEYDYLFSLFCDYTYEETCDDINTVMSNFDYSDLLRGCPVGSYLPFIIDIDEITLDNARDVTERIWRECEGDTLGEEYTDAYVYVINLLQDLEDNYMTYWTEFLRSNDFPGDLVKEIEEKYNKDKEKK